MLSAGGRVIDVGMVRAHAMSLSREHFIREYPGYYLVVTPHPEALNIGYRTVNMTIENVRQSNYDSAFDIVPVTKAPQNPYPDRVSVGRATNCDIVLRDASVSKLHAHFHDFDKGPLRVIDLGSSNGTKVNNAPIEAQKSMVLEPGDTLQIGGAKARVADGDALYEFLR
ncbi:FHA domain-containing protein [Pendulispora rubella]|uniref:FHA domain-containing protein n=1 Tax=Pendulispora rubella TaxID=2741070 RepID=A0ABZ2LGN1_9BACT